MLTPAAAEAALRAAVAAVDAAAAAVAGAPRRAQAPGSSDDSDAAFCALAALEACLSEPALIALLRAPAHASEAVVSWPSLVSLLGALPDKAAAPALAPFAAAATPTTLHSVYWPTLLRACVRGLAASAAAAVAASSTSAGSFSPLSGLGLDASYLAGVLSLIAKVAVVAPLSVLGAAWTRAVFDCFTAKSVEGAALPFVALQAASTVVGGHVMEAYAGLRGRGSASNSAAIGGPPPPAASFLVGGLRVAAGVTAAPPPGGDPRVLALAPTPAAGALLAAAATQAGVTLPSSVLAVPDPAATAAAALTLLLGPSSSLSPPHARTLAAAVYWGEHVSPALVRGYVRWAALGQLLASGKATSTAPTAVAQLLSSPSVGPPSPLPLELDAFTDATASDVALTVWGSTNMLDYKPRIRQVNAAVAAVEQLRWAPSDASSNAALLALGFAVNEAVAARASSSDPVVRATSEWVLAAYLDRQAVCGLPGARGSSGSEGNGTGSAPPAALLPVLEALDFDIAASAASASPAPQPQPQETSKSGDSSTQPPAAPALPTAAGAPFVSAGAAFPARPLAPPSAFALTGRVFTAPSTTSSSSPSAPSPSSSSGPRDEVDTEPSFVRHARRMAAAAPTTLPGATAALLPAATPGNEDKNDFEAHAAALCALPRLVRGAATSQQGVAALLDAGPALLRGLLTLEDRYALPDFGLWRLSGLQALAATLGPAAPACLLPPFFSSELSDGDRLLVLDTLVGAARELAGREPPAIPQSPWEAIISAWEEQVSSAGKGAGEAQARQHPTALVRSAATRAAAAAASAAAPNRFASLARQWFFTPLLQRLLGSLKNASQQQAPAPSSPGPRSAAAAVAAAEADTAAPLLDGDAPLLPTGPRLLTELDRAPLLAQALLALAVFLEAADAAPDAVPMLESLLPLLWLLRHHAAATVRRAVLSGLATVLAVALRLEALTTRPSVLHGLGGVSQQLGPVREGLVTVSASPTSAPATAPLSKGSDTPRRPLVVEVGAEDEGVRHSGAPSASSSAGALAALSSVGASLAAASAADGMLARAMAEPLKNSSQSSGSRGKARLDGALAKDARAAALGLAAASASSAPGAPPELLLLDDVLEIGAYLADTVEGDPDDDCRALAGGLLQNPLLRATVTAALGPLLLEEGGGSSTATEGKRAGGPLIVEA